MNKPNTEIGRKPTSSTI